MTNWDIEKPHAPYCTDVEVQRLRDLWRPDVQAGYRPHGWRDESGAVVIRPDDYDPTQHSLWMDYPMYVIPPDIAKPFEEELQDHVGGPFFEGYGSWEDEVLHGAQRFLARFIGKHNLQRARKDSLATRADCNFEGPFARLGQNNVTTPQISVEAPVMERQIDYTEFEGRRIIDTDVDFGAIVFTEPVTVREHREGILGWTVPIAHKQTGSYARSLLRAKNHLVSVNWYGLPAEKLSFWFQHPQLSKAGEAMLDAALVELEPILPAGTNYQDIYEYHPRLRDDYIQNRQWRGTNEARDKACEEARV